MIRTMPDEALLDLIRARLFDVATSAFAPTAQKLLPPMHEGPNFSGITEVPGTHRVGVKFGPELSS